MRCLTSACSFGVDAVLDFIWSAQFGYKLRFTERIAVYGHYVFAMSEEHGGQASNVLEFAGQFEAHDRLVIGPGILFGLDDHEDTPEFGAGIKFTIGF